MSNFSDAFARSGAPNLVRHFGDPIDYTDANYSAPLVIDAKLTAEKKERRNTQSGWQTVTTRTARYITDNLGYALRLDGTVLIGDVKYSIEHINSLPGGMSELALKRVEAGEVTRPNYRSGR